jgi:predicted ribonuclease YlaK
MNNSLKNFYDTSALLTLQDKVFESPFLISMVTLQELEHIKTSTTKDADTKYKARKMTRALCESTEWSAVGEQYDTNCTLNNDSRIINDALPHKDEVTFVTYDLCHFLLARNAGLQVKPVAFDSKNDDYKGYIEVTCNDESFCNFYSEYLQCNDNIFNLYENQYLLLKSKETNIIVDAYVWVNKQYKHVHSFSQFQSTMFGKTNSKDAYQACAMDSLEHNQINVLRGPAGTGKSLIALSYLFQELEHGRIDRIIIFCNTVATAGAAKLGFYTGSKTEKLLDSQIGNFLMSKLGDKCAVEALIAAGQLILLPMSDIRGFDTTGLRAGIYITEAQNLDINLMKLALQRIGADSICILDGDDKTQVDMQLYAGSNNGLRRVSEVFRGDSLYGEVTLKNIYRSHIAELADKM